MQKIGNSFKRKIIFSILLISIFLTLTCSKTTQTTIYRDTWGIPHIYSNSEANLAFAFGYAQAEDRLIQILRLYRYAEGTLSEAFGERYVDTDYVQRVWQHAKISRKKFSELSPDVQKIINYFVAGVKQYMKEHPEKVPENADEAFKLFQKMHKKYKAKYINEFKEKSEKYVDRFFDGKDKNNYY